MLTKVSGGVSLVDRVAEVLSDEITSGRLSPGDRLPSEVQLVEQLGVSRTVVREAVSRLRNAGLVEPRQGSGVFVLAPRVKPVMRKFEGCTLRMNPVSSPTAAA